MINCFDLINYFETKIKGTLLFIMTKKGFNINVIKLNSKAIMGIYLSV